MKRGFFMKKWKKLVVGAVGLLSAVIFGSNVAQAGHLSIPADKHVFIKDGERQYLPLGFQPGFDEYTMGFSGWGASSSLFSEKEEIGDRYYTGPNRDFVSASGRTHYVYPEYGNISGEIKEGNGFYINNAETYNMFGKVATNKTNEISIRVQDNKNYQYNTSGYDIALQTGLWNTPSDHYRYFLKGEVAFIEGDSSSAFRVVTSSFSAKGTSESIAAISDNYTQKDYKSFSIPIAKQIMFNGYYGIFIGVHSDKPEIPTEYSYQNIRLEREKVVSLNEAALEELQLLTGIGTTLAQRIIDYRSEGNSFQSFDDLMNIKGIGKATVTKIKAQNLAVLYYQLGNNPQGY